jgi:hypothetical protein
MEITYVNQKEFTFSFVQNRFIHRVHQARDMSWRFLDYHIYYFRLLIRCSLFLIVITCDVIALDYYQIIKIFSIF